MLMYRKAMYFYVVHIFTNPTELLFDFIVCL